MNGWRWTATCGLGLALLGGCGDDGTRPVPDGGDQPRPETVVVEAWHRDAQRPVPGVKIVLMDGENRPVATPAVSDSLGRATFAVAAAEPPLAALAFPGDSLAVVSLPDPVVGADTVQIVLRRRTLPGGLPRIAGRIVDAATGEPLAGAFVSLSSYLIAHIGQVTPSDDVTLADGEFRVSDIPFARDPDTGNLFQILPLLISRAGYRPLAWSHAMRPGDEDLDIAAGEIALQPDPGGEGTLTGRVVAAGEPVADLAVGLGPAGESPPPAEKGAVGWPGHVVATDSLGVFAFGDLPPGRYVVHPAFRLEDGWAYPGPDGPAAHDVADGQVVDAGDFRVLPTITALAPVDTVVDLDGTVFRWAAVAAPVDSFRVLLDGEWIGATTDTVLVRAALELEPGWHVWTVSGFATDGTWVAARETWARFEARDEPE